MITRDRLEELIEQGATIFILDFDIKDDCYKVKEVNLSGFKIDNNTGIETKEEKHSDYVLIDFDETFETKEEAEWHKEFGCIERTERLELPTWEEFDQSEKLIRFIGKFGQKCKIEGYFNLDLQSGFIDVTENGSSRISLPEYTKENYILACRKAKELFLGDSYE